jgi:hypothetical protein
MKVYSRFVSEAEIAGLIVSVLLAYMERSVQENGYCSTRAASRPLLDILLQENTNWAWITVLENIRLSLLEVYTEAESTRYGSGSRPQQRKKMKPPFTYP